MSVPIISQSCWFCSRYRAIGLAALAPASPRKTIEYRNLINLRNLPTDGTHDGVHHPMPMLQAIPLASLALPGVLTLISFLSYGPQILFHYIEPYSLDRSHFLTFNALLCCIWVCYLRACFTDAGRVPINWTPPDQGHDEGLVSNRRRWCKKCERYKPPRAHHCKTCKR